MREDSPILTAKARDKVGTRYSQRVRQAGGLPAVLYGHGEAPVAIAVDHKETLHHLTKGEKIFRLQMEGESDTQFVLIKALQFDHLGTNPVHADFARVDLEERTTIRVPIHIIGEAVGLKEAHTVLMHPTNEIEIECKVANLPDSIELDITDLEAGGIIHASDIQLPLPTMKLMSDPEAIIAQVAENQHREEEDDTAEAGEVTDQAEPEVITEKKEDEEG